MIFINLRINQFFLFADDNTLLFAHKNLKVLEQVANSELSKVSEWLVVNKLSLNIRKSNLLQCVAIRYMDISSYLLQCVAIRFMEISMYLLVTYV